MTEKTINELIQKLISDQDVQFSYKTSKEKFNDEIFKTGIYYGICNNDNKLFKKMKSALTRDDHQDIFCGKYHSELTTIYIEVKTAFDEMFKDEKSNFFKINYPNGVIEMNFINYINDNLITDIKKLFKKVKNYCSKIQWETLINDIETEKNKRPVLKKFYDKADSIIQFIKLEILEIKEAPNPLTSTQLKAINNLTPEYMKKENKTIIYKEGIISDSHMFYAIIEALKNYEENQKATFQHKQKEEISNALKNTKGTQIEITAKEWEFYELKMKYEDGENKFKLADTGICLANAIIKNIFNLCKRKNITFTVSPDYKYFVKFETDGIKGVVCKMLKDHNDQHKNFEQLGKVIKSETENPTEIDMTQKVNPIIENIKNYAYSATLCSKYNEKENYNYYMLKIKESQNELEETAKILNDSSVKNRGIIAIEEGTKEAFEIVEIENSFAEDQQKKDSNNSVDSNIDMDSAKTEKNSKKKKNTVILRTLKVSKSHTERDLLATIRLESFKAAISNEKTKEHEKALEAIDQAKKAIENARNEYRDELQSNSAKASLNVQNIITAHLKLIDEKTVNVFQKRGTDDAIALKKRNKNMTQYRKDFRNGLIEYNAVNNTYRNGNKTGNLKKVGVDSIEVNLICEENCITVKTVQNYYNLWNSKLVLRNVFGLRLKINHRQKWIGEILHQAEENKITCESAIDYLNIMFTGNDEQVMETMSKIVKNTQEEIKHQENVFAIPNEMPLSERMEALKIECNKIANYEVNEFTKQADNTLNYASMLLDTIKKTATIKHHDKLNADYMIFTCNKALAKILEVARPKLTEYDLKYLPCSSEVHSYNIQLRTNLVEFVFDSIIQQATDLLDNVKNSFINEYAITPEAFETAVQAELEQSEFNKKLVFSHNVTDSDIVKDSNNSTDCQENIIKGLTDNAIVEAGKTGLIIDTKIGTLKITRNCTNVNARGYAIYFKPNGEKNKRELFVKIRSLAERQKMELRIAGYNKSIIIRTFTYPIKKRRHYTAEKTRQEGLKDLIKFIKTLFKNIEEGKFNEWILDSKKDMDYQITMDSKIKVDSVNVMIYNKDNKAEKLNKKEKLNIISKIFQSPAPITINCIDENSNKQIQVLKIGGKNYFGIKGEGKINFTKKNLENLFKNATNIEIIPAELQVFTTEKGNTIYKNLEGRIKKEEAIKGIENGLYRKVRILKKDFYGFNLIFKENGVENVISMLNIEESLNYIKTHTYLKKQQDTKNYDLIQIEDYEGNIILENITMEKEKFYSNGMEIDMEGNFIQSNNTADSKIKIDMTNKETLEKHTTLAYKLATCNDKDSEEFKTALKEYGKARINYLDDCGHTDEAFDAVCQATEKGKKLKTYNEKIINVDSKFEVDSHNLTNSDIVMDSEKAIDSKINMDSKIEVDSKIAVDFKKIHVLQKSKPTEKEEIDDCSNLETLKNKIVCTFAYSDQLGYSKTMDLLYDFTKEAEKLGLDGLSKYLKFKLINASWDSNLNNFYVEDCLKLLA